MVPELARGCGPDPDADGAFVDIPLVASEDAEAEAVRRQQVCKKGCTRSAICSLHCAGALIAAVVAAHVAALQS